MGQAGSTACSMLSVQPPAVMNGSDPYQQSITLPVVAIQQSQRHDQLPAHGEVAEI